MLWVPLESQIAALSVPADLRHAGREVTPNQCPIGPRLQSTDAVARDYIIGNLAR